VCSEPLPLPGLQTIDVLNVKKIEINVINVFIRKKIVNVCKLKVNVHRA